MFRRPWKYCRQQQNTSLTNSDPNAIEDGKNKHPSPPPTNLYWSMIIVVVNKFRDCGSYAVATCLTPDSGGSWTEPTAITPSRSLLIVREEINCQSVLAHPAIETHEGRAATRIWSDRQPGRLYLRLWNICLKRALRSRNCGKCVKKGASLPSQEHACEKAHDKRRRAEHRTNPLHLLFLPGTPS